MSNHLSGRSFDKLRMTGFGEWGGDGATLDGIMGIRVKICGITNREDALAAIEAGADALGFILYERSKRFIPMERAVAIAEGLPPFVQTVAVTVDATREFSNLGWRKQLKTFGVAQLHGHESPVHVRAVSKYLPVIKALPADQAGAIEPEAYAVSAFLLDTPTSEYGGTGRTFDWELAVAFKQRIGQPLILSGGLNPENVAKAIEAVHPYAIDVSSGVESSPGKKDHAKVRDFIQICKRF
jgi:phosphoribosylanthranilate isomerase